MGLNNSVKKKDNKPRDALFTKNAQKMDVKGVFVVKRF